MKITTEQLKSWSACADGFKWFLSNFPAGEGEYQAILDALCEDDRPNDAAWLLEKAGKTDDIFEAEELAGRKHFVFAGSVRIGKNINIAGYLIAGRGIEAGEGIEAGLGIEAGRGIKAGWGIEAGLGIEAGEGIEAGRGIEAGLGIKAGEGIGIFAGLKVKISDWKIYAKVSAKAKPENLISGVWIGDEKQEVES